MRARSPSATEGSAAMVHVTEMGPPLGAGIPKSPSFHQGLAYAAENNEQPDPNMNGFDKYYDSSSASALQYQPLQPLLVGTSA